MTIGRCRITVGVVVLNLLLVTAQDASAGMRFGSDVRATASCQIEACDDVFSRSTTGFLLDAPCPPTSNVSLICEFVTTALLSCEERTVIIKKCLLVYPQELKCYIVKQCEPLECLSFRTLLNDCDRTDGQGDIISGTDDKVVLLFNGESKQTEFILNHSHSKMADVTELAVTFSNEDHVNETDDFPVYRQPMREESDNLVWLAALLLLLIPLIFIIWFCCKRRRSQKDNKYPKQEDSSSTAALCKAAPSVNECSPTAQSGDFENLDLPFIDSEELDTVRTECPPHVENTVT